MRTESKRFRWKRFSQVRSFVVYGMRLAFTCGVIAAAGCGQGRPPTGTVRGTVTIHGERLAAGQVCVISEAGVGAIAMVAADGTFGFTDPLPMGEYTAWLEPPAREPGGPPGTSPSSASVDEITWQRWVPRGYRTQSSSPLRFVVQPGANAVPIEIAD